MQSIHTDSDSMTRDGEIPAIFNPKRVRTPSVVVTGDSPNGPYGGFTNILNTSNPQITHQDSISSSQQDPNEVITIQPDVREPGASRVGGAGMGGTITGAGYISSGGNESDTPTGEHPAGGDGTQVRFRRLKACRDTCCSELARKVSWL